MKRAFKIAALLTLIWTITAPAQQMRRGDTAVFRKVLSGVTTPQASPSVQNIGQAMHIITVIFPQATAAVSGFQVRIEASYDNQTFFPISPDITTAPRLGGITYQIEKAYVPWPYIRVRSLIATAEPMDVWYSGHMRPVVPFIAQELDRFIL